MLGRMIYRIDEVDILDDFIKVLGNRFLGVIFSMKLFFLRLGVFNGLVY